MPTIYIRPKNLDIFGPNHEVEIDAREHEECVNGTWEKRPFQGKISKEKLLAILAKTKSKIMLSSTGDFAFILYNSGLIPIRKEDLQPVSNLTAQTPARATSHVELAKPAATEQTPVKSTPEDNLVPSKKAATLMTPTSQLSSFLTIPDNNFNGISRSGSYADSYFSHPTPEMTPSWEDSPREDGSVAKTLTYSPERHRGMHKPEDTVGRPSEAVKAIAESLDSPPEGKTWGSSSYFNGTLQKIANTSSSTVPNPDSESVVPVFKGLSYASDQFGVEERKKQRGNNVAETTSHYVKNVVAAVANCSPGLAPEELNQIRKDLTLVIRGGIDRTSLTILSKISEKYTRRDAMFEVYVNEYKWTTCCRAAAMSEAGMPDNFAVSELRNEIQNKLVHQEAYKGWRVVMLEINKYSDQLTKKLHKKGVGEEGIKRVQSAIKTVGIGNNMFWSSGLNPEHPARYACGVKTYHGEHHNAATARVTKNFRARTPYVGEIHVVLLSADALTNPNKLGKAALQVKELTATEGKLHNPHKRLAIKQNVSMENELLVPGGLLPDEFVSADKLVVKMPDGVEVNDEELFNQARRLGTSIDVLRQVKQSIREVRSKYHDSQSETIGLRAPQRALTPRRQSILAEEKLQWQAAVRPMVDGVCKLSLAKAQEMRCSLSQPTKWGQLGKPNNGALVVSEIGIPNATNSTSSQEAKIRKQTSSSRKVI